MSTHWLNQTSVSVNIEIVDAAGLPVTGLVASTFPAIKIASGAAADVTNALNDLSSVTAAFSAWGVRERGEGVYRLDVPDTTCATSGVKVIRGYATGKVVVALRLSVSVITAAQFGTLPTSGTVSVYAGGDTAGVTELLTRIPDAAPGEQGGLPTLDADGLILAKAEQLGEAAQTLVSDAVSSAIDSRDLYTAGMGEEDAMQTSGLLGDVIAAINTRASATALAAVGSSVSTIGGNVTTLINRLTQARADNLDYLDASITSRMATFAYTTPPTASANASAVRTEIATELAGITTAATAATAASTNALAAKTAAEGAQTAIAAVKVKTDNLPASPASSQDVDAATQAAMDAETAADAAKDAAEAIQTGGGGDASSLLDRISKILQSR